MTDAKAIALWANAVKKRAMNRCEFDGCACQELAHDAHHLVGRKYQRYRYDVRNGMALCRICHQYVETHPNEFITWCELNRPDLVDWILGAHVNYKSPTQEEMDELKAKLVGGVHTC